MKPYHDAGAPGIEPGVLRRLHRLDPDLFVTWSPVTIDVLTGQPLVTSWGERIPEPSFWLWLNRAPGDVVFVRQFEWFGHREVEKLERDAARQLAPKEMMRKALDVEQTLRKRARDRMNDYQHEKHKANKKRMEDWLFEQRMARKTERDGRAFSGAGVATRSTPGPVPLDPHEDGWDIPQTPQL